MSFWKDFALLAVIAVTAWAAGHATRDVSITVTGACTVEDAYEPPADPGFAAPGSDAVSLEWLPDQGEA